MLHYVMASCHYDRYQFIISLVFNITIDKKALCHVISIIVAVANAKKKMEQHED